MLLCLEREMTTTAATTVVTVMPMRTVMTLFPLAFSSPDVNGITHSHLNILTAFYSGQLTLAAAAPTTDTDPVSHDERHALCTICFQVFDVVDLVVTNDDDADNRVQILCANCLSDGAND